MAFENPARVVVLFSGLLLALHTAHAPHLLITFATQVYRSILIFSIGYGLYTLMGSLTTLLAHLGERVHMEIDSIVMPFLTRILQFVVMALTVTMILSDWGINVNGVFTLDDDFDQSRTCWGINDWIGVFAGLGLVGLAVSMAAQDQQSRTC